MKHLFLAGALLTILIAGLHFWLVARARPYRELRANVHKLQRDIESYAVQIEGSYPPDLGRFLQLKHMYLPPNPFGHGSSQLLKPTDPWQPGGIVYVPFGPIVAVGDSDASLSPIIPTDTDQYVLLAYSPRKHPRPPGYEFSNEPAYNRKLDGIDWDHVEVMLTAGEDPTRGN